MSDVKSGNNTIKRRGRRNADTVSGREVLLSAAMSAFAKQGYDGASLRKIAAEAGVDMALVARLFGSKAELWQAVVLALAQQQKPYRETVDDIREQYENQPQVAFRVFVETFTDLCFACPELEAFFMQETTNPNERLEFIKSELVNPFMNSCLPLVNWLSDMQVIKVSNSELYLKMLFAAISVPIFSYETLKGQQVASLRQEIIEQALRAFGANK